MVNEEIIMQLSMMEQRASQLQQQLQSIDSSVNDLERLKLGLGDLQGMKGKEILASIGMGMFVKAIVQDNELITDVGDKKFVKKDVSSAQSMINSQVEKLEKIKEQLLEQLQELNAEFQSLIEKAESKKE